MIVYARGRVFATPSAMTVLVNGEEVHSGQVGTGLFLNMIGVNQLRQEQCHLFLLW
jgi:hypothetical protein